MITFIIYSRGSELTNRVGCDPEDVGSFAFGIVTCDGPVLVFDKDTCWRGWRRVSKEEARMKEKAQGKGLLWMVVEEVVAAPFGPEGMYEDEAHIVRGGATDLPSSM
jgi:hypothetical protein